VADPVKTPEQLQEEQRLRQQQQQQQKAPPLGHMMQDRQRFYARVLRRREAEADNP
jgi:hypothetical protein